MIDPRSAANALLTTMWRYHYGCTNLKLQKLLFLAYSHHLIERRTKLFSQPFEAWQYGPVQPLVYETFKAYKAGVISKLATGFDPVSRQQRSLPIVVEPSVLQSIDRTVLFFGEKSAASLVTLTHMPGSAWARTVDKSRTNGAVGLRISDDMIYAQSRVVPKLSVV